MSDDTCVVCGTYLPEGYGHVCMKCYADAQVSRSEARAAYFAQLLALERRQHSETRRKLEKADHDRQRYAKRIRFLQGRHEILCREYRALKRENETLIVAVNALERRLLDEPPAAEGAAESAEAAAKETARV